MTDQVARMRSEFVSRASKVLVSQLLDDFLEDRIVNDDEKDSIVEENRSRAEQARCLVDMAKRKGDAACWKMIAHLEKRDPTLYAELELTAPRVQAPRPLPSSSVPNESENKVHQDAPVPLRRTTEEFWRKKQKDKDVRIVYRDHIRYSPDPNLKTGGKVYPVAKMNMNYRVALLIVNVKFRCEELNRKGAEEDEREMERLLTDLGYRVVKYLNLTGPAMDQALMDFSQLPDLSHTDSVVVVIMSHGQMGVIAGIDWNPQSEEPDVLSVDNIYKRLSSENCPALVDKPKIIIIQACRGGCDGYVFVEDAVTAAAAGIEDDTLRRVHKEKDFISLLSSTPDTASYRHRFYGSLLIQFLVQEVNASGHEDDIEELFRKVMARFENKDIGISNKRQMPTKDRCTLTKRFYFFPGLGSL